MPKGSSSSSSPAVQQLKDSCQSGDIAAVRKLFNEGVDVNWKDTDGWTALMWASAYGHVEVVKLLLERGALIDIQNDNNESTALMIATANRRTECARLLLEKGADMSIKNKDGKTAKEYWVVEKGYDDIVQLLNEYEAKKKNSPPAQLPQAQVLGELVLEPLNKALQEENARLKTENAVFKDRELSKNKEILCKQDLVDEYKARAKNMEEENQKAKDEVQRFRDEAQRFRDELSSLKEKEAAMKVEIEYLKRRDEELRLERNTDRAERTADRAERTADRAMFQTMMSSLMTGLEDRKRKRYDEEETK